MAETNFENAELNLVIIDRAGVATTAFLRQSASSVVSGPSSATDGGPAVFDGTTGKSIRDSGIKIFEALISQSGGSDPIISVFRSTLDITVTSLYVDTGIYILELDHYAFIEYAMIEIGCGRRFFNGSEWIPNLVTIQKVVGIPLDTFFIHTYVFSGGDFRHGDDVLHETPLRVTVYPH